MMHHAAPVLLTLALTLPAASQTLTNAAITGKYFFRHLMITTTGAGAVTDIRSLIGTATYNGSGGYTFTAQQNIGTAPSAATTGSGTYSVSPSGAMTMTNPSRADLTLNAKFTLTALLGATTDTTDDVFDLFVAIPAPTAAVSNAALSGAWWTTAIEVPSLTAIRNSRFLLRPDGAGALAPTSITGHAANQRGQAIFTESINAGSYALAADGSGTATFPGATLLAASKSIYLSRDGTIAIGGSTTAGAHDFLIAIKSAAPAFNGRYYAAGLRFDATLGSAFSAAASANGAGTLVWSQRVRQRGAPAIDFTGVAPYVLAPDGSGTILNTWAASSGPALVASTLDDPATYEIYVAARMPDPAGPGVFLNPQGIVNTASFAPAPTPLSPGQFAGLFGSNLAPRSESATTATFPTTLAGVTVSINGVNAPISFVSPGQISVLVPFSTTGATARIRVTNNGQPSSEVVVPLAATAPGIFTQNQAGTGLGAILKADFSLITAANPARRNDAILIFLTGLGAVDRPVADGTPAPTNPLARTTQLPKVYIGGKLAQVLYSGLAPGYSGLYQLNVQIPADAPLGPAIPIAIETTEHFHDQADLPIAP